MTRTDRDGGQVVPLIAGVIVLVAVLALLVADLGHRAVNRASAQSAADAAALAAASAAQSAPARTVAVRLASRYGATVVDWWTHDSTVVVTVQLDGARATAAARSVTGPDGPAP